MEIVNSKRYIDYKVYEVTPIKNKYGFRVKLIFDDSTELVQQKSGYTSKREAKNERDKIIGELYSGTYIVQTKLTVRDFYIFWLENEMKIRITDDSYKAYKNIIYHHIIPKIGNITMVNLNKGHIQKLYEEESKKSHSSLRLTKAVIDSGMKYALRKGIITHNPAVGVKIPKGVVAKDYKTLHIDEQKTLTIEQLQILIQASMGTSIYLPILFSAVMGLRRGEVNGVKYSDVDFINRKLKLQRQLGIVANSKKEEYDVKTYTKQEIPLKTHSSYRELDIPDIVFEAILEERKKYEKNKRRRINDKTNPFQDLDYICCSSYGRPRSRTYCFPHFKKILKENNLPDIRWHDLRATYATILLKNDFSIKAISKRMGHSKQIITVDVYGDKKEIIKDCTEELMPFIEDILPTEEFILNDYTEETQNLIPYFDDLISEVTDEEITLNDYSDDIDTEDIFSNYGIAINM